MASQRIETRDLGNSGGLQTNVAQQQSNQNNGLLIADNVTYRPVGGISKRRGSKKIVDNTPGETKRLLSPNQNKTGILTLNETDSTGSAKVLGYNFSGKRFDAYAQQDSFKVLLDFDDGANISPYQKVRLEFEDDNLYSTSYHAFIEDAFEQKLNNFNGFFTLETQFTTVSVHQDSVDPNLLRISKFLNLPTKLAEIVIEGSNSLATPPTLLITPFDIISVDDDYFTVYLNGSLAPAWTSTGDTGTIDFRFETFKVISVPESALSTQSLIGFQTKAYYETQGVTPSPFSTSQVSLCLENRSGDEIVFNADQGQMYFSDENPDAPKVSYYGVPRGIDIVGYTTPVTELSENGPLVGVYGYVAVFKKVINNQTFIGAPSPFFTSSFFGSNGATVALVSGKIVLNGLPNIGQNVFVFINSVTSTPQIPQFKVFKAEWSGANYWIIEAEQAKILGSEVTSLSSTGNQGAFAACGFCSITIPELFYEEYNRNKNLSNHKYYVDVYRTNGVVTGNVPNYSELFLIKSEQLTGEYPLKHILVKDDEVYDADLESQLPLYTNIAEEGPLKANLMAPRHQNFTEKNGIFYLGDLTQKKNVVYNSSYESARDFSTREPIIESDTSLVTVAGQPSTFLFVSTYFRSLLEISVTTGTLDYGVFDSTAAVPSYFLTPYASGGYFLVCRIDTGESFVAYVSDTSNPLAYQIRSLNGDINEANENKTLKCIFMPLWFSDGTDLKFLSIDVWVKELAGTAIIELANHTYAFIYRSLNLSFSENPSWVTSGISVTNYYQKSNFVLYFSESRTEGQNAKPDLSVVIERKNFISYSNTFPSWLFFDEDSEETFELQPFRYQIAYSKPFEPAAFPALQFLQVGSTRNIIYGIFKVRDSLIIASKEGFYRLSGDNELDYSLTLIEGDTTPLTPLLMAEQSDTVFALTQKGIARCSENNLEIIDLSIQNFTERFLRLYRDDLDNFTIRQLYTASPSFLNQIVFYMPSLSEKNLTKSIFGISYDTLSNQFSTVDLLLADEEKTGVLLQSFDGTKYLNNSFNATSHEPSALQIVRNEAIRSDFAQHEEYIQLSEYWQATASIFNNSNLLVINTQNLNHELELGDYVTLIDGANSPFVTAELSSLTTTSFDNAIYPITSITSLSSFTVTLNETSNQDLINQNLKFRFGRSNIPATVSLTQNSTDATLTISTQADVDWLTGQKIYILEPYITGLQSSLNSLSSITGSKRITSVNPVTLNFSLSENATANFSGSVLISDADIKKPFKQAFSIKTQSPLKENSIGIIYNNDYLIFPFQQYTQIENTSIQGFLERALSKQIKADRPSKLFTGVKATLMTSRITGGDPCALKNFDQVIITMQSILSCSQCELSFEGDRYSAADSITFWSQINTTEAFDPAFANIIWSFGYQQWDSITNFSSGWRDAAPFVPIRVTTPSSVAQSTYLNILLRHSRPFETFAMNTIAINGSFIDPTSVGV